MYFVLCWVGFHKLDPCQALSGQHVRSLVCGVQVSLRWESAADAAAAADSDVGGYQLLVDGVPVGEPLIKTARQVTIDQLKPGQELDVSLLPLDGASQPLGASNVVKVLRASFQLCRRNAAFYHQ